MEITVRDIASRAGVSATTVSLVLNKKDQRISEKTRQKILAIANELNYTPNQIAVSLATKKSYTLGLILPDMSNLFFSSLAVGVERYAQMNQYSLFLCNSSGGLEKCISYIGVLEKRYVDGIIIVPPGNINSGTNYLRMREALDRCKVPYVLLERAVHDVYHDFVTSDNKVGGYLATEHLAGLGHTKIGCITGPLSEYGAMGRLAGYREVLEENHIPGSEDWIYEGDYSIESGFEGANRLIDRGITAIFACNDMMAIGALRAAAAHGVSVPQQLSVVGYDNNPVAELLSIPLTTVSQPAELMGRRACEILLRRLDDPNVPHRDYYFSPALIVRNTTAKPLE